MVILHTALLYIQHSVSIAGVLVILAGVLQALYRYLLYFVLETSENSDAELNSIRIKLGRVIVLGLEFIVAADLIGTTTAPDYYSVGIVACIVLIRTVLSYTLNKELMGTSTS